jgi:hypothetical protein
VFQVENWDGELEMLCIRKVRFLSVRAKISSANWGIERLM